MIKKKKLFATSKRGTRECLMCPPSVGAVPRKNDCCFFYLAGQLMMMNFGTDGINDSLFL